MMMTACEAELRRLRALLDDGFACSMSSSSNSAVLRDDFDFVLIV